MDRRTYLDLVSGGVTAALSGALPSIESAADEDDQDTVPQMQDFLVQKQHLREGYDVFEQHAVKLPEYYYNKASNDVPTPRAAERSFALLDEKESAPAELLSRAHTLPDSTSPTPDDFDRLYQWVLQACWNRSEPPNHGFTDWVDVVVDDDPLDGRRHTLLWARIPLLQRRTDQPEPDPAPSKPHIEYATVVHETDWGVLDISLSVDYPAERKQTLRTVRRLAKWQSQLVETLPDPDTAVAP